MKILLGDECIECDKNADDRCPRCSEPVHRWEKYLIPIEHTMWGKNLGGYPLPCYEQHRKTCTR